MSVCKYFKVLGLANIISYGSSKCIGVTGQEMLVWSIPNTRSFEPTFLPVSASRASRRGIQLFPVLICLRRTLSRTRAVPTSLLAALRSEDLGIVARTAPAGM